MRSVIRICGSPVWALPVPSDHNFVDSLLARCTFPEPGTEVVCAVSGGADSLALLVLAGKAGLAVTAVHVDHGLRPFSADEAEVVAAAARRFGAAFRAERVEVEPGPDLENRARQARYRVIGREVMTGHTADDQAETLLINLLRGAGVNGLSGMQPGYRHPILALRRTETERVCSELGLDPVEDPSNRDPRFVRNRIRHEVLPLLADVSKRDPVPLLNRTADHARQTAADIETLAADLDPTDCRALRAVPLTLARAVLRGWLTDGEGHPPSTAELDRVMAVVNNQVVACEITPDRRVSRTGQSLRLTGDDQHG